MPGFALAGAKVEELRSVVTFPNKLQRTFRAPTTAKTESLVQTNRWKRRRTPTGLLADRTTMLIDFDDTPTEVVSRSFAVAKFDSQGVP
jgi:hypothetical protein